MTKYDICKREIIKQTYLWDLDNTDNLIQIAKVGLAIDNFLKTNNALELKDKLDVKTQL